MNARIESIVEQAKALDPEEREALIAALQLTLDPPDPDTEAAWVAECIDRLGAIERGEMKLIDANEVMERARARLRAL
ncbi:MAG: addiction module protein [Burkholderiales bacterium]|nr:addiction module protein [Burkholderiales bacterium]